MLHTKFLLVDDDADDASMFCEALKNVSPEIQCHTAENGQELFDFLDKCYPDKPDIIFLDINMPVMNGWQCLQKLKDSPATGNIPVIMYSTSSARRDILKAYDLGVNLFLTKPDDFDELTRILRVVATSSEDSIISRLKGFQSMK